MVSWIVKNSTEKLAKKIPIERITAAEAKEIFQDARVEKLPEDWLERVLKDIDRWIKWSVAGGTNNPYVYWDGTLAVTNKYGKPYDLPLSRDQLEIVKSELSRLGFSFQIREPGVLSKYKVGW